MVYVILPTATPVYLKSLEVEPKLPILKITITTGQNLLQNKYYMIPTHIIPYPTAFPYGNGMVLHFYQQQESSMTKTVHKVINKGLKTYV